jgi:hypothetical protein
MSNSCHNTEAARRDRWLGNVLFRCRPKPLQRWLPEKFSASTLLSIGIGSALIWGSVLYFFVYQLTLQHIPAASAYLPWLASLAGVLVIWMGACWYEMRTHLIVYQCGFSYRIPDSGKGKIRFRAISDLTIGSQPTAADKLLGFVDGLNGDFGAGEIHGRRLEKRATITLITGEQCKIDYLLARFEEEDIRRLLQVLADKNPDLVVPEL